jgi:hypothetical protein
MTWTITKTCGICEHYPYHEHCIGCKWDEGKGENTKWELKKNPIVIERAVLDKIKAEFISRYPKNYMGEPELGGRSCVFSLNKVLEIIDKYKSESEDV